MLSARQCRGDSSAQLPKTKYFRARPRRWVRFVHSISLTTPDRCRQNRHPITDVCGCFGIKPFVKTKFVTFDSNDEAVSSSLIFFSTFVTVSQDAIDRVTATFEVLDENRRSLLLPVFDVDKYRNSIV